MTLADFILARVAEGVVPIERQAEEGDDLHPPGEPCSYCEKTWAARRYVEDPDRPLVEWRDEELRALAAIWSDHPDYNEEWAQ